MRGWVIGVLAALGLSACATTPRPPAQPVEVQILAINDFHGNLEVPKPVDIVGAYGVKRPVITGGAGHLAAALAGLRRGHRETITVSAGDLIGASPLTSAYFLDEPTILAMNRMGLAFDAVGNHEFDRGHQELVRMQRGGCEKYTTREPCRVQKPFKGARFQFLAANVIGPDGQPIFAPAAVRQFGPVKIGFIGMTLKETATLASPSGVAGLTFADEAATANALVPKLKAQGVDAIVLMIHQGGRTPAFDQGQGCNGLTGDIVPILARLDPAITTIISGHTHWAYVCQRGEGGTQGRQLMTSAGKNGYFVTDLRLSFDRSTRQLLTQRADNLLVGNGERGDDAVVAALVSLYSRAAAPIAGRPVGQLSGPASYAVTDEESPAADLVADAQLAATAARDRGAADLSFINATGVRTDLIPAADGTVTFGQIFALQPFGNNLVVKTLTGAQLKALLEQQFAIRNGQPEVQSLLVPSANFRFTYDLNRPNGQRIQSMLLKGKEIDPAERYRVTVNNFLASGGDGFSVLIQGTDAFDAGLDLDALESWLATNPTVPTVGRTASIITPVAAQP